MNGPVYTKNGYGVFKLKDGKFAVAYRENKKKHYDMIIDDCESKTDAIKLINEDLNKK